MDQDTLTYDSLSNRPLPKWLTDQRDGLTTIQPVKKEMKADNSLSVSFTVTGAIIFLVITVLTVVILRKKKNHSL